MKISKASWMILAAGVFIIILAGLGVTRTGQITEYENLSANLSATSLRLNNFQSGQVQTEINEYQQQLKDIQSQTAEVRDKLKQTVISVDVSDKFYEIADYCGVIVGNMGTSTISTQPFAAIDCETTSLSAQVTGTAENIVKFVLALNDNFSTGFVRAANLSFDVDETGSVGIQMIVYSRKGTDNGE